VLGTVQTLPLFNHFLSALPMVDNILQPLIAQQSADIHSFSLCLGQQQQHQLLQQYYYALAEVQRDMI
jgi:hypothetical protein